MKLNKLPSGANPLAMALAALLAGPVSGQCLFEEDQKLIPGDSGGVDYFGSSAASWDNQVLIGAENKDLWVGGAYLWEDVGGTWVEVAALEASDGVRYDLFGASVAMDADWIVVGATQYLGTATETGKVYVYDRSNGLGTEDHILLPSLGEDYDQFGHKVAIQGDVLVVSAIGNNTGADSAGAVYVFEFDGTDWVETQVIHSPNPTFQGHFGDGLAFDGSTLMVGSPGDGTSYNTAGAVYVYSDGPGGFTLDQSVFGVELNDRLGAPLAMSGDHALAGLRDERVAALERIGGTWQVTQTLLASDNIDDDEFGSSLAIEGTRAAIGAAFVEVDSLDNVGAVYAFHHDGVQWLEVGKLVPQVPQAGSQLGSSVAINGDRVLAGAEREDPPQIDAGAVYSFSVPDLGFDVQPNQVAIGSPVSFLCSGGSASAPLITFATAVNGVPLTRRLFMGNFDPMGAFRLDTMVPNNPALSGTDLSLITFALMANGRPSGSNVEVLMIQ